MSTSDKERFTIPASHGLDLADLVQELGGSSVGSLGSAGMERAALEARSALLGLAQMQTLVSQAIAQTRQPWIGVLLGLRMRVPAHGFLGFAAMNAATVREAL